MKFSGKTMMAAITASLFFIFAVSANAGDGMKTKPKLVLQITVDQLRGDLPTRYYDRLGEGGFRYLWEKGVVYTDAHHAHANTETIVGHATLATGAHPAIHGMIGNVWLDRESNQTTYNIEDPDYRLLTKGADVDAKTEIDPTQRAARSEGRSPAAILVTTFSDELKSHSGGKAKVFGVSVKDRGAVSMAGHAGKAFWFSKAGGEFVTSSYYYDQYPQWVIDWNDKKLVQQYAGKSWKLLHDQHSYLFGDSDDRAWETDVGGFGRVFPHPYAQEMWHLQALNSLLMQTSTLEGNSLFFQALKGSYVLTGLGFGVVTYGILMVFGLPVMLIYGVVRGLGQTAPHGLLLEVLGAFLGRHFFMKRYGAMWRQYAPVLLAGFSCGMGLTGMFAMGFTLILKSLGRLAF